MALQVRHLTLAAPVGVVLTTATARQVLRGRAISVGTEMRGLGRHMLVAVVVEQVRRVRLDRLWAAAQVAMAAMARRLQYQVRLLPMAAAAGAVLTACLAVSQVLAVRAAVRLEAAQLQRRLMPLQTAAAVAVVVLLVVLVSEVLAALEL